MPKSQVRWHFDSLSIATSVSGTHYSKSRPRVATGLGEKLHGYEDMGEFVQSLEKPR